MRVINVFRTINEKSCSSKLDISITPYVCIDDDEFYFSVLLQQAYKEFAKEVETNLRNIVTSYYKEQFGMSVPEDALAMLSQVSEHLQEDDDFDFFSISTFNSNFPEVYEENKDLIDALNNLYLFEVSVTVTEAVI